MFTFQSLPKHLQDLIFLHLKSRYPEEGCGLIFLDKKENEYIVFPVMNKQDDDIYVISDGKRITDKTNSFIMDLDYLMNIVFFFHASKKYSYVCQYHSHIDCDELYMSHMDKYFAMDLDNIEVPFYENLTHMIFSVKKKKIIEVKCYKWNIIEKDFIEIK